MIIEVILRLMMLTISMLIMIGLAVCFSVCRVLWEDGDRLSSVAALLLAVMALGIALFAGFC